MSDYLKYRQAVGHCPRCGQSTSWTIKHDHIPAWAASGIRIMPSHVEGYMRCNRCGLKMPESEWQSYQAGVAELADAPDLGSGSVTLCRFESYHPHHYLDGELYD